MRWLIARYARAFALMGYQYPWYYMVIADGAILLTATLATVQRVLEHPSGWEWIILAMAFGFAAAPHIACLFVTKRALFTPALVIATVISVILFWQLPTYADAATLLLVLGITTDAAVSTWKQTTFNMVMTVGVLVYGIAIGAVEQGWLIAAMLCFGVAVGRLLQVQLALLVRERQARAARLQLDRVTLATEVHDVIAHSLSIVLLNVTGARRALQEDNDTADAIAALLDAEQQGRAAMADIRQTIELLRANAEPAGPTPGLSDLDELVSSFQRAGQDVRFRYSNPGLSPTSATELATFRIVQESLTNASKHAPGATVDVEVGPDSAGSLQISVRNKVAPDTRRRPGGSGLSGMRSRTEHLGGRFHAAPNQDTWEVNAVLPFSTDTDLARDGAR
jgi:signal transduction histidine kinase